MHDAGPNEVFDPHFFGQRLETTYFDTEDAHLRKARRQNDKYLTLRVRSYRALDHEEAYALSAKTESQKFRTEIDADTAGYLLSGRDALARIATLLPANVFARLLEITTEQPLRPCVTITCQRYAIEDDQDRFTLDTDISTDLGKAMPYAVVEFKSTKNDDPPQAFKAINLHAIKLSKFLWATNP
jgi:hypothetical protein